MADARGLAHDEILISADTWHGLRDAIYVAETTAADALTDLTDADTHEGVIEIVMSLRTAISGVVDALGEPRAVGSVD